MLFRLAGHLGMTVGELGKRMTANELTDWMILDQFHPLPDPWLQTATLCQCIATAHLKKLGGGKWKPQDFMPIQKTRPKFQSEEETKRILDSVLNRFEARSASTQ